MAHLVFQTAFPGDLFLSIPLLKRLRSRNPDARIFLACRPRLGDFFLFHKLADEVLEIDKRSDTGRRRSLATIKGETWDLVLVPHESPRTALWMSRVRAREGRIGFSRWWNRFAFDKRVARPLHLPDALRQLSLLTPVDDDLAAKFADQAESFRNPTGQQSPQDLHRPAIPDWASMQVLPHRPQGRTVFLAPGSVWATKRWTPRGYEELARALLARGHDVELVGSPAESGLCAEIAKRVPGVRSRAGETSLTELAELLSTGLALVSNDSGAMHVAAAVNLPTVAVFGPTTLALGFRPWNDRAVVVQRSLKCRPCGTHGPQKCPLGTHECMETVTAADVLSALQNVL